MTDFLQGLDAEAVRLAREQLKASGRGRAQRISFDSIPGPKACVV